MTRRAAILLVTLLVASCSESEPPAPGTPLLPWQVELLDNGATRVFGLTLGESSFGDAESVLGDRYTLALFGPPVGVPQLEAFYREVALGGLTGRMVLNLSLPEADLTAMRERSPDQRVQVEGSERRWDVADDDLALARQGVISVIGYVPAIDLEPEVIETRFGKPANRLEGPDGEEYWLYPKRGLAISVNPEGREFIQYVLPADFERLRAPLKRTSAG